MDALTIMTLILCTFIITSIVFVMCEDITIPCTGQKVHFDTDTTTTVHVDAIAACTTTAMFTTIDNNKKGDN